MIHQMKAVHFKNDLPVLNLRGCEYYFLGVHMGIM